MRPSYKNFDLAAYLYAYTIQNKDIPQLRADLELFLQSSPLDKVYIESHRATTDIPVEKLLAVKALFEEYGIKTAGGITSTGTVGEPKPSIYDTYCYTDKAHRDVYLKIVEVAATAFDEIILDDFFFTACRCEKCIAAKKASGKSWKQYRLDLMEEFSHEIVDLAKKINPKVKFVIKYPNWYESFQECGYNPGKQKDIFDGIYTGTETRDAVFNSQHLQRYESYSLVRLLENTAPGRNGGGWIDLGGSAGNLSVLLDQAELTYLAGAKEMMLFNFESMYSHPALAALAISLQRVDEALNKTGNPVGVSVYEPYDGDGEDQLLTYLGMCGIPMEPKPWFDKDAKVVFLTATSACDENVMDQLEPYVLAGGNAIVTTGFFKRMYDKGICEMTSLRLTGRHILADTFMMGHYNNGYVSNFATSKEKLLFEGLQIKNNATWADVRLIAGEENFPLLSEDRYGKGFLYVLNLPECFSDMYKLPREVWQMIGKEFGKASPVYAAVTPQVNFFAYDNNVYALHSYLPHGDYAELMVKGENNALKDLDTGRVYTACGITPRPMKMGDSVNVIDEPVENIVRVPLMPGRLTLVTPIKA